MEKRAGDGNWATGAAGRAFNAYTGRRLRAIDGGSARFRQTVFG